MNSSLQSLTVERVPHTHSNQSMMSSSSWSNWPHHFCSSHQPLLCTQYQTGSKGTTFTWAGNVHQACFYIICKANGLFNEQDKSISTKMLRYMCHEVVLKRLPVLTQNLLFHTANLAGQIYRDASLFLGFQRKTQRSVRCQSGSFSSSDGHRDCSANYSRDGCLIRQ